ncbi:MAG TPA: hypothetical protein GX707_14145 [Epulopiscium sp.]|nr:hypothetical protein [Candidatus Epulonipiscium sp.]
MRIIIILDSISTSAQDLIRWFFGVKIFRKYAHATTPQPEAYPASANPITQKTDG